MAPECDGRSDRIRTCDPRFPKPLRYRAALRSDGEFQNGLLAVSDACSTDLGPRSGEGRRVRDDLVMIGIGVEMRKLRHGLPSDVTRVVLGRDLRLIDDDTDPIEIEDERCRLDICARIAIRPGFPDGADIGALEVAQDAVEADDRGRANLEAKVGFLDQFAQRG